MLWQLFKTFFLIGAFTFGGGVAMIPIIEEEVVTKKKWLTPEEFLDVLAVTQSSPGVLAANMSTYVGYQLKGVSGAVVSCLGAVLPSVLIITLIATFFMDFRDNPIVDLLFLGIRPAVAALIGSAVYSMMKKTKRTPLRIGIIALTAIMVGILGFNPIWFLVGGGVISVVYDRMKANTNEK